MATRADIILKQEAKEVSLCNDLPNGCFLNTQLTFLLTVQPASRSHSSDAMHFDVVVNSKDGNSVFF